MMALTVAPTAAASDVGFPGTDAGHVIAPAAYARRLTVTLAVVHQAQGLTGASRRRALDTARALLASNLSVRVHDVVIRVDLSAARDDLTAGRLTEVVRRLTALREALAAPSAHLSSARTRDLASLDDILRPPTDLWTMIGAFLQGIFTRGPLAAIIAAINRLFHGALLSASTPTGAVVPYVAGIIAAVAIVFAINRSFGALVPHTGATDADGPGDLERLDEAAARERATALAAAGDYRTAARYVYLSTLLALDATGRVRIDEATGNRDVLRQVRGHPALSGALTPVVRGFELYWFGHAAVTRVEYERYRELNERALQVAR